MPPEDFTTAYRKNLIKRLMDKDEALDYLRVAFDEPNIDITLTAIEDVRRALMVKRAYRSKVKKR